MCEPTIRNHHYNFVKNQADSVLRAHQTVADPKILESVRASAQSKRMELLPDVPSNLNMLLESIADIKTTEDFHQYLQALEPYLMEFPPITDKQIRKLFPKNKKLKVPDLTQVDFRKVSYLSWIDISTNKMYIVYHADGQFVGIEGRYTAANKKSYCFVCNRYTELVLFSAISKKRPAHTSPDYYKSVGNYICANGHDCNKNVTDMASLEQFIHSVQG